MRGGGNGHPVYVLLGVRASPVAVLQPGRHAYAGEGSPQIYIRIQRRGFLWLPSHTAGRHEGPVLQELPFVYLHSGACWDCMLHVTISHPCARSCAQHHAMLTGIAFAQARCEGI